MKQIIMKLAICQGILLASMASMASNGSTEHEDALISDSKPIRGFVYKGNRHLVTYDSNQTDAPLDTGLRILSSLGHNPSRDSFDRQQICEQIREQSRQVERAKLSDQNKRQPLFLLLRTLGKAVWPHLISPYLKPMDARSLTMASQGMHELMRPHMEKFRWVETAKRLPGKYVGESRDIYKNSFMTFTAYEMEIAVKDKLFKLPRSLSTRFYHKESTGELLPEINGEVDLTQLDETQLANLQKNAFTIRDLDESVASVKSISHANVNFSSLYYFTETTLNQYVCVPFPVAGDNKCIDNGVKYQRLCQLSEYSYYDKNQNIEPNLVPELLFQLTSLRELSIGVHIKCIPESLGQLTLLQNLDLRFNRLEVLPSSIGQLVLLKRLDLGGNYLADLPEGISQLIDLEYLNLMYNRFASFPSALRDLPRLSELNLDRNYLAEIPPHIGTLSNLRELSLSYNQLTSVPPEIGHLSLLRKLDLGNSDKSSKTPFFYKSYHHRGQDTHNKLTTLPVEMGSLTNLEELCLCNNLFKANPKFINQLPNLKHLDLSKNPFAL